MERILLFREVFVEIWITLPKRLLVAVVDSREAVIICLIDGIAATWQAVTVREFYRPSRRAVRSPISFMIRWIAPCSFRVPMPRFAGEFSAQPISQRLQTGREHRLNVRRRELPLSFSEGVSVHASAQRLRRYESICRFVRDENGH